MKKVFMPSIDELYIMQDMNVNIYKYLLIKAVESLIVEGKNYPNKGILKSLYTCMQEDPDLVHIIGRMYPDELKYSLVGRNDMGLCEYLLEHQDDQSIYGLDNLARFDTPLSMDIEYNALMSLSKKLGYTPKYRFEYKECELLDRIFGREFNLDRLSCYDGNSVLRMLSGIEPSYAIDKNNRELLLDSLRSYFIRYGIVDSDIGENLIGKDILTNKPIEVKRLIRCINNNGEKY